MSSPNVESGRVAPGRRLREAWADQPIAVPGVLNALVARMAERLGFRAGYISGAALSAAYGLPDIGLLTLDDFVDHIRHTTEKSTLPLVCDADTGFGEALNVERAVRLYEAAGAAGIQLEDQQLPKRCGHLSGKQLVAADVMAAKVRAAAGARMDPSLVIVARTDARGVTGFQDAVDRARLYLAAGADAIFPEALESVEEFAEFTRQVQAPLVANMTEFGRSPRLGLAELGDMGYRMVLFPVSAFRAAMRSAEQILRELAEHGRISDGLAQMLTRRELYELLDYDGYEARDRSYFH